MAGLDNGTNGVVPAGDGPEDTVTAIAQAQTISAGKLRSRSIL